LEGKVEFDTIKKCILSFLFEKRKPSEKNQRNLKKALDKREEK
jgi:hypothetical protein